MAPLCACSQMSKTAMPQYLSKSHTLPWRSHRHLRASFRYLDEHSYKENIWEEEKTAGQHVYLLKETAPKLKSTAKTFATYGGVVCTQIVGVHPICDNQVSDSEMDIVRVPTGWAQLGWVIAKDLWQSKYAVKSRLFHWSSLWEPCCSGNMFTISSYNIWKISGCLREINNLSSSTSKLDAEDAASQDRARMWGFIWYDHSELQSMT